MRVGLGTVLVVAAVLTSPVLGALAADEVSLRVALTRYLVVVEVTWVALTVAAYALGALGRDDEADVPEPGDDVSGTGGRSAAG